MIGGDLRPADMELLDDYEVDGFSKIWEDELHRVKSSDRHQERWHLARMALLAGQLLERGRPVDEVLDILKDHREGSYFDSE